jgi:hypothetical protein
LTTSGFARLENEPNKAAFSGIFSPQPGEREPRPPWCILKENELEEGIVQEPRLADDEDAAAEA